MDRSTFRAQPLPWRTDSFPGFLSPNSLDAHYELYRRDIEQMNRFAQQVPALQQLSLAQIANDYLGEIGKTAAQAVNHEFFWRILSPPFQGGVPSGRLYQSIVDEFGSFPAFIQKFNERAANQFGSGWVWFVYDPSSDFFLIDDGGDAYNPGVNGYIPLLALDLWEHSYYPDYGMDKRNYINNFWRYINWSYIEQIAAEQIFLNRLRVDLPGQT